jgi:hypothetical protein
MNEDNRSIVEHRWDALTQEVNSPFLFGPFLRGNGMQGQHSTHLHHTGFSLLLSIPEKKIDAWILRHTVPSWMPVYVLLQSQIEFSFYKSYPRIVDDLEVISFSEVLQTVLALRKDFRFDVRELLEALVPLNPSLHTPLKRSAAECLQPYYRQLGLAMTQVKVQKATAYTRLVWTCPKVKGVWGHYYNVPVCSCWIEFSESGALGNVRLEFPWTSGIAGFLRHSFLEADLAEPKRIFSSVGLGEIATAIDAKKHGGHQRTKHRLKTMQIVRENRDLWDSSRKLVLLLREKGQYSAHASLTLQEYQVESIVRNLRLEEFMLQNRVLWNQPEELASLLQENGFLGAAVPVDLQIQRAKSLVEEFRKKQPPV